MGLFTDVDVREIVATPTPHRHPGGGRRPGKALEVLWTALRGPLAVYAVVHGLVLAYGVWLIDHQDLGYPVMANLGAWDVKWYALVADHGYEHQMVFDAHGTPQMMRIAFFPLMPLLMRYVSELTGVSSPAAGIGISVVLSFVAAAGIHRLLRPYVGDRTALLVVALWASLPPSFVQNVAYTEALFVALTSWALVALVRRHWLTAGVLTAISGLSRSTAFLMVGVLGVAALIAFVRTRSWRPLVAALLAPLGLVSYFVFLRVRLGRWDGWWLTEKAPGWSNKFDFGQGNFETVRSLLAGDGGFGDRYLAVSGGMALFGAFCLLYLLRERRLPWEVYVWTVTGALFTLMSQGNFSSVGRYLSSFFPLFVPLAGLLSRSRLSSLIPVFVACCVAGAYIGAWFFTGPTPP